ncbi:MAG: hypothetical protein DRJ02_01375 [Bacteroidetes bacterium]|nr:MAG: hypothetical protein DRI72_07160 [Bacteroidota bacterium]RLD89446.1 MAG: hypothetical protein DRJ02_01375 [Bacteroidota bacterium]
MPEFLKILSVFMMATVKYFYAPLFAYFSGLGFWESMTAMVTGGVSGFLFFYYISHFIVISAKYMKPTARKIMPESWLQKYRSKKERRNLKKKQAKKFTRRNRMLIRMRKAGMWAVILTTPVLLSIPLGAFLLRKYYHPRRGVVIFTAFVIIFEGALLCYLVWNVPSVRP